MPPLTPLQLTAAYRRRRYGRRYVLPSGGVEKTVTFGSGAPLGVKAWIALGADLTQSWLTWNWFDITPYVRWTPGVTTSQGRRDQDDTVAASTARATISNPDGLFARLNPMSPLWGLLTRFTPIRFAVDPGTGYTHRYFGFVNDWPKRWRDKSANDPVVNIVCRGPMHRLLRSQNLRSAAYRAMSGSALGAIAPAAYWPMEDGHNATQFASAVPGVPPMVRGGHLFVGATPGTVSFAAESTLQGSLPLPVFGMACSMLATIPAYPDTGQWVYQIMLRFPRELDGQTAMGMLSLHTGNASLPVVFVDIDSLGNVRARVFDAAQVVTDSITVSVDPTELFDQWVSIGIASKRDGSGSDDTLTLSVIATNGTVLATSGPTVVDADFHGPLVSAEVLSLTGVYPPGVFSIGGAAYGHAVVYADPAFTVGVDDVARAVAAGGHLGEMTHERIGRICAEIGTTLQCDALTSARLGAQPPGNPLTVMRDAAKADLGLLYEYEYGLGYLARSQRYNQPVGLTLDITQGQIVDDLEPADDDLRFRNRWTVSRAGGSSYTADADGGLSDEDQVYEATDTFGLEADSQLPDLGGWLVSRDTVNEDYWPNLGINLAKNPELITGWLALPFAGRVNVTGVMDEAGVDTIDAVREGWTEHWNSLQWDAKINSTPASVFDVGVYETGRYDSAHSTLATAVDEDDTSLTVVTEDNHAPWITTADFAAQFPFDIGVEGIRLTVTDITSATSPQTFTVTRSVDGFDKPLPAGKKVRLWTPARYAL